jgi:hypothetical protein
LAHLLHRADAEVTNMTLIEFYTKEDTNEPLFTIKRAPEVPRLGETVCLPEFNSMEVVDVTWYVGEDGSMYAEIELSEKALSRKYARLDQGF